MTGLAVQGALGNPSDPVPAVLALQVSAVVLRFSMFRGKNNSGFHASWQELHRLTFFSSPYLKFFVYSVRAWLIMSSPT